MPYLPRQLSAVLMVVGALFTGPLAAGAGAAVSHGDLLNKDKQILEEQEGDTRSARRSTGDG